MLQTLLTASTKDLCGLGEFGLRIDEGSDVGRHDQGIENDFPEIGGVICFHDGGENLCCKQGDGEQCEISTRPHKTFFLEDALSPLKMHSYCKGK